MLRIYTVLIGLLFISCAEMVEKKVVDKVNERDQIDQKMVFASIEDCKLYSFKTYQQQADYLLKFLEKAKESKGAIKKKWEQQFFCAFPNSFEEMKLVFGYDDDLGAAPLYNHEKGSGVLKYFSELASIPDAIYYKKYIAINIGGKWEADHIREAFGFADVLESDTQAVAKALSMYTDEEIESVFRFVFDSPHPNNNQNLARYNHIKSELEKIDLRLSTACTNSFTQLLTTSN